MSNTQASNRSRRIETLLAYGGALTRMMAKGAGRPAKNSSQDGQKLSKAEQAKQLLFSLGRSCPRPSRRSGKRKATR